MKQINVMKLKYTGLLILLGGLLISSCKKQQTEFENPYAGGKAPLGIVSDPQQIAVPSAGIPGTEVSIKATGLVPHKEKLTFLFNGQEAQIVEVTATGIRVKVPAKASSGVTAFVVGGQLVFGPTFTVIGKVNLDPTYVNTVGANGAVFKAFPIPNTTNLMLLGSFDNYDNKGTIKRLNRIVRVFADGTWDRSLQSGSGANATLTSMAAIGPYYYVVGDFTGYAQQGSGISKITRLFTSGAIDTVQVVTYTNKTRWVPKFNGGVSDGSIREVYPAPNTTNKMIVVGNFNYYVTRRYNYASYLYQDSTVIDTTECRQLARLDENGKLDSTWRFDKVAPGYRNQPGKSWAGGNGSIFSYMHTDGKLLIYGRFTKFDDVAAGYITRLNPDGTKDLSFNPGTGANNWIVSMSYDATQNKYIAVGNFTSFNGKAAKYIVRLNYDGTVDDTFVPKEFGNGTPQYVKLLSDGLIVVNGDFRSYDGVIRNGMLILDKAGNLAEGYNTTGNFSGGSLIDVYETKSADQKRALLMMGSFSTFDSKLKNNIVRVTIE